VVIAGIFIILRPDEGPAPFPALVYAASNALFPLMCLFLWLSVSRYGAYASLYTAGKFVGLVAVLGWFSFSQNNLFAAMLLGSPGVNVLLGSLLFMFFGDLLCAAGGVLLVKKLGEGVEPGTVPEVN
jgi:hypothetical protein